MIVIALDTVTSGYVPVARRFHAEHWARVQAARAELGMSPFPMPQFARAEAPIATIAAPRTTLGIRSGPKLLKRA